MAKRKQQQEEVSMTEEKGLMVTEEAQLESLESEIDKARQELERTKLQLEEKKKQLESMPAVTEKNVTTGNSERSLSEKIAAMKAYDCEKVTGKFINRRAPGHVAKLTYMKYADDPVKWYEFRDGGIYTIPRGFADQINEHYYTPHFIQKTASESILIGNESAGEMSTIAQVDTSNKKYAFVPQHF